MFAAPADQVSLPVPRSVVIRAHAVSYLYGVSAATIEGGAEPIREGDFVKCAGDFTLKWQIEVQAPGDYEIRMNCAAPATPGGRTLVITAGEDRIEVALGVTHGYFGNPELNYERVVLPSFLHLSAKPASLMLAMKSPDANAKLSFRSLELVPASARMALASEEARAVAARAQPAWLSQAGYGVMFHWTSKSVSSDGAHKPYAQAVQDFDVPAFAEMVKSMGAAYVIFTVGHAEPYCPAPIKAWEKYHPGKTTSRDLVMEIADQLAVRGVKLLCYFPTHIVAKTGHVGEEEFMRINREILQEFGERYGPKVAGYWFDGWYQSLETYPKVAFEEFYRVCKAGDANRIIAINSWFYPVVTPWQDYWAGEVGEPVTLPKGRIFNYGPARGLPYHALLTMEPYWVQESAVVPPPRFTPAALSEYIRACHAAGGCVTINLGIFQNGSIGSDALQVMREVRRLIRR